MFCFVCHVDVCNVEQLLCNVDILSTFFLIMIGYDLMYILYSSPILVI